MRWKTKMQEANIDGKTQKVLTIYFFEPGRENISFASLSRKCNFNVLSFNEVQNFNELYFPINLVYS